jgi:hypothetical protein
VADLRATGIDGWSPQGAVDELSFADSWMRLGQRSRGRLGVSADDQPGIYPVDYIVDDDSILFRTAEGEKLYRIRRNERVVFEVEGDLDRGTWSVIVTGLAQELIVDPVLEPAAIEGFPPWAPIEPYVYVRILPTSVRGRQWDAPHAIERD